MITSYFALKIADRAFGDAGAAGNWLAIPLTRGVSLTKEGGSFGGLLQYVPLTAVFVQLSWTYYDGAPPYVQSSAFSFLNQTVDPAVTWRIGYIAVFLGTELAMYQEQSVLIPAGESIGVPAGVVFSLSSPGG